MFGKAVGHKKTSAAAAQDNHRERLKSHGDDRELFLPGALLVTIQAQLLAPFVFIYLCLAAFFQ
jgi:hypothetical protein